VDPVRSDTYGIRKGVKLNRKITTAVEGAGYQGVFAAALEGSRKVRVGEPATEGGEVTLSLKGGAIPHGGIRARRDYAPA
jgi:hypothetical protein